MIVSYKDLFGQDQQIEVTGVLENIIQQYQYELSELEKENRKLEKENFVMKDRLKFGYKGVTREEIDKAEKEKRKLENKILRLGTRIYQNIDGEKRKEYQEYCKRHRL